MSNFNLEVTDGQRAMLLRSIKKMYESLKEQDSCIGEQCKRLISLLDNSGAVQRTAIHIPLQSLGTVESQALVESLKEFATDRFFSTPEYEAAYGWEVDVDVDLTMLVKWYRLPQGRFLRIELTEKGQALNAMMNYEDWEGFADSGFSDSDMSGIAQVVSTVACFYYWRYPLIIRGSTLETLWGYFLLNFTTPPTFEMFHFRAAFNLGLLQLVESE